MIFFKLSALKRTLCKNASNNNNNKFKVFAELLEWLAQTDWDPSTARSKHSKDNVSTSL